MDQPGTDREGLLAELKERLDEGCIVFGKGKNVESLEEIAMTDEAVLDYFMEHETVRNEDICRLIRERKIFPCYFGSALKLDGVQELLAGFEEYADSLYLYHCVVGGYVCLSGGCGFQSEHPDTVCAGACHRYGGG